MRQTRLNRSGILSAVEQMTVIGSPPSPAPLREIRPVKRRVALREMWTSRQVAWIIAKRDLKVRYKQSVVGTPWLVLQPLGILAGLLFVFDGVTQVNTGKVPYVVFALVGMCVWTFVQTVVANGVMTLITNGPLIRRVAFPRTAFYTAMLASSSVGAIVILFATIIAMIAEGVGFRLQALLLPLIIVWLIGFLGGVLFIIATLTAKYRDAIALVPFWSQAGMFLTPVGYPVGNAPPTIQTLLDLNPLTGLVEMFRWSLLGTGVETLAMISCTIGTVVLMVGGWRLFTRMETRFADYI